MYVTKEWTFDAAHRLVKGYEGKCAHLHGHTYKVEVMIEASELDQFDMVVNFDWIKAHLKNWCDEYLDHGTMVSREDRALLDWLALTSPTQKHFVFRGNPTAEEIADLLHLVFVDLVAQLLPDRGVSIRVVRVWETPTSSAIAGGVA